MLVGRVNFYLAIDADKRTKATAISRIKTIRMAAALLYGLRRADAKRRKGNRAVIKIAEQRTKGNFLLFALPCCLRYMPTTRYWVSQVTSYLT